MKTVFDKCLFYVRRLGALIFIITLMFAVRLPYIGVPLDRDEGGYAYGAQILARGDGVPYRDTFEHKGPFLFFVYYAAFALFGETSAGIHLMMNVWLMATVLVLYLFALRVSGERSTAFFTGLSYIFLSFKPVFGMASAAITELYMVLPLTLAAFATWEGIRRGRRALFFAGGLAAGLAVMTKQTAVFETAFFFVFMIVAAVRNHESARETARRALLFAAGCIAVPVFFFSYFAAKGAADDFIYFTFLYNLVYPSLHVPPSFEQIAVRLINITTPMMKSDVIFIVSALAGILFMWKRNRAAGVFASGWFSFSCVSVVIGFVFYPHYFQEIYPALAFLAGAGLAGISAALKNCFASRVRPAFSIAWPLAISAIVIAVPLAVHSETLLLPPGKYLKRMYGPNPFPETVVIGEYIKKATLPGDTVYVFGSEPQIFFYAQRKSAMRYIFTYPLWERFDRAGLLQRQAADDLRRNDPAFIVLVNIHTSHLFSEDSGTFLVDETSRLIHEKYELCGMFLAAPDGYYCTFDADYLRGMRHPSMHNYHPDQTILIFKRSTNE